MGADLDGWIAKVRACEYLPENDLKLLCQMVKDLLVEESNVQPVSTPAHQNLAPKSWNQYLPETRCLYGPKLKP